MSSGLLDLSGWGYVVAALLLTHVTIASVTIFLHRAQAHRALELHPIPSHFFRFWLWLTTGMITKEWAAIHRKHHAKCETAEDPHSPQVKGLATVLFGGAFLYRQEAANRETIGRYGHGTPDDWLERHVYTPYNFVGILLMLGLDMLLFGVLPGLAIWVVQMVWIPFWAAGVINGVGHYWGYRNFACADASTNIAPWGIIIGGEELHNNHHSFATSAKLSAKWYEFDIGWMYICILRALGMAKVRKVIPSPRFIEPKVQADLETLQAIVTHRYHVVTSYVAALRQVISEEVTALKARSAGRISAGQVRRWFVLESAKLGEGDRAGLAVALAGSKRLETLYAMREDLFALWQRSTASSEQLVKQLQDWCAKAEASGIAQLQEFSRRLRRYAL